MAFSIESGRVVFFIYRKKRPVTEKPLGEGAVKRTFFFLHNFTGEGPKHACQRGSTLLCAANYVACRLREIPPMGCLGDAGLVRSPAAVRFMASAMANPMTVKGALCHALWILTPVPELLKGRKVICHTVVLADILNAGAVYVPEASHVVVDRDLVTGRSAGDLELYGETLVATFQKLANTPIV